MSAEPPQHWPAGPATPAAPPSQGPSAVWAGLLWGLAAISLIGALAVGALAVFGLITANQLADNGVTTTATVTKVNTMTDTVTVEFTTEEYLYATDIVSFSSVIAAVGDEIDITYDPDDPYYAIEAGSDEDFILAGVLAFCGMLGLAFAVGATIGAILVHRARGDARRQRPTW
jgi:hypothetical protein